MFLDFGYFNLYNFDRGRLGEDNIYLVNFFYLLGVSEVEYYKFYLNCGKDLLLDFYYEFEKVFWNGVRLIVIF